MAYEWSRNPGNILVPTLYLDPGSKTSVSLNSAFIYETSGGAWICKFLAPDAQTTSPLTVYAYVNTVTGIPTDVRAAIYDGNTSGDADRPESAGTPLETTGAVDLQSAAGSWATFSFSSVTLVAGQIYFIVIDNRTATPASNYPDITYRGAVDCSVTAIKQAFTAGYTANGITSDPVLASGVGTAVVKTNSGALIGQPYVNSDTPWVSANDRGIRFTPSEDIVVSGAVVLTVLATGINFEITESESPYTNILTHVMNFVERSRGAYRFAPTTLTGGTSYDCVFTASGSSGGAGYYMGEASPPADVLACRGPGVALVYGSAPPYTEATNRIYGMALIVDDMPAIAGGLSIVNTRRNSMIGR